MMNKGLLKKAGIADKKINQLEDNSLRLAVSKSKPLHKVPYIVCTGIYNAGKSTLLNALLDVQHFPTGDIPTTKSVSTYDAGYAFYMDTPGLNADEADDEETLRAYQSADITLFVSSTQNGGITEAEAQWLLELKAEYGTQERFTQRFLYALTQCGQIDDDRLPVVADKFRSDFQRVLGFPLEELVLVDAHSWIDGTEQNEELLKEYSKIVQLRTLLEHKSQDVTSKLKVQHQADIDTAKKEILSLLRGMEQACEKSRKAAGASLVKQVEALFSDKESSIFSAGELSSVSTWGSLGFLYCGDDFRDKSEYSCERRAKEKIISNAEKYLRQADQQIRSASRDYGEYGHAGMDSVYFKVQDKVNQKIETFYTELMQTGIHIKSLGELTVSPDLADVSRDALYNEANRSADFYSVKGYGGYVDLFFNRCEVRCSKHPGIKKGLFGMESVGTVTEYYVTGLDRVDREIYNHVQDEMKEALKSIEDNLNYAIRGFNRDMKKAITSQLKSMKTDALKQAKEMDAKKHTPFIDALAHIEKLKKEVNS